MIERLKIGHRLLLGFGVVLGLVLLVGLVGISTIWTLAEINDRMFNHPLAVSNSAREIRAHIYAMHRSMKDVALASDEAQITAAVAQVEAHERGVYSRFVLLEARFLGDPRHVRQARTTFAAWRPIRQQVIVLTRAGDRAGAVRITRGKGARHVARLMSEAKVLVDFANRKAEQFHDAANQTRDRLLTTMVLLVSLVLLASLAVVVLITRSITGPVGQLQRVARKMARGDLTARSQLRRDDELGTLAVAFDGMADSVQQGVDQLEARVARRTASLDRSNRQLRHEIAEREQAAQALAQADRLASLGLLAAGVAHEINNPLMSLVFNLKLLTDSKGAPAARQDPDAAQLVRESAEAAQKIQRITRDLQTFARVDDAPARPVSVNEAVESAARMAGATIRRGARLKLDLGQVPLVLANDGRLAQVFLNLLINAAHAMVPSAGGHGEIRVRTWRQGQRVMAEVADTGKGIAAEHMDQLFEPFFTTKEVGVGSGLGLAICKGIVDSLGGTIEVQSQQGQGTRLLIGLPAADGTSQPAADPPALVAATLPQDPPAEQLNYRVLVVDDEPTICTSVRRMLRPECEVVVAHSGLAAAQILGHDQRFDAIICDVMMPDLSGLELHQMVADHAPELAERFLLISGGTHNGELSQQVQRSPLPFLHKPFTPQQLRSMVLVDATTAPSQPDPN